MENLADNIHKAGKEFLAALDVFNGENFNQQPFEGSWTPGEVAEHVLKQVQGVVTMLNGHCIPTDRPADANVNMIRNLFLDFSTKMKSPDFILPSPGEKDKDEISGKLKKAFGDIGAFAASGADLTLLCDFDLPHLGKLSRLEWIHFADVHTQRHTHQLKEIASAVTA